MTAEGIKEKAAAPPPAAGGWLEAGAGAATPGPVSGFGGVLGVVAVPPAERQTRMMRVSGLH